MKIYSNWETLKNGSNYDCAEIIPDGQSLGKWIDALCKKNYFVCQRMPNLGVPELKKELNSIKTSVGSFIKQLNESNKEVDNLKKRSNETNKFSNLKKTS